MLYYQYKTMFSAYKSVIVTPCACNLFVSKLTKITQYMDVRFWRSFFGTFSVCDDCILKSTTAWLLKLSVLYIHSFIYTYIFIHSYSTMFYFQLKCITPCMRTFWHSVIYIYIFPFQVVDSKRK